MAKFSKHKFQIIAHSLLAILLIVMSGRSEANCIQANSVMVTDMQAMEDCSEMLASVVDQHSRSDTNAPGHHQPQMCHIGCLAFLASTLGTERFAGVTPEKYIASPPSSTSGINSVPRTPPPRSG